MKVNFPGLGLEFMLNKTVFTLPGGWPVQWYGLLIATGFLLAAVYAFNRAKKDYHINIDRMIDVVLMGAVAAIIGARLYYVLFDTTGQFVQNPISALYIWEGGLAFYGALIGALGAAILGCKWRKIKLWSMFDLLALGFLIGQAVGRWGNFFNQEAFGSNTTLPWGMISEDTTRYLQGVQESLAATGVTVDPTMPVHPCFLYESLWLLLGFLVLHFVSKKRKYDGQVFFLYIIWNCAGRIFIEALRTDSLMIFGVIKVSQLVALLGILFGATMLFLWRKKRDSSVVEGAVTEGDGKSRISVTEILSEASIESGETADAGEPEQTKTSETKEYSQLT